MRTVQKQSCVEVVVDASPGDVWDVVSDVTRVGEWSHECRVATWVGGDRTARKGARFRGGNRAGRWSWSRLNEIVSVDAHRELVWRTVSTLLYPDSTEWRIELEPSEGGTTVRQSFRVLRAPWLLDRLYATLIPAHRARDAELRQDLLRLGVVAQRGARSCQAR